MKEKEHRNDKLMVANIQRMCMHDGPGIRTTVFLKGCNLHCPWCANPECISLKPQTSMSVDTRKRIYGREYETQTLYQEIIKDFAFWKNGGGVTFSGGEPLLQAKELEKIFIMLKDKGVHIAVETALMMDAGFLQICMPYVDLFIIDIKILIPDKCSEVLGGKIENYYANLKILEAFNKEILFRIPCNKEYTLQKENIIEIKRMLQQYQKHPVEIFATHSLAQKKYEELGLFYRDFETVTEKELDLFAKEITSYVKSISLNTI